MFRIAKPLILICAVNLVIPACDDGAVDLESTSGETTGSIDSIDSIDALVDEEEEPSQAVDSVIYEVTIDDDLRLEVFGVPGEQGASLFVVGDPMRMEAIQGMRPGDSYEMLTGRSAPYELQDSVGYAPEARGTVAQRRDFPISEFACHHAGGKDIAFCVENRTTDWKPWIKDNGFSAMGCKVGSRGEVKFRIKRSGTWIRDTPIHADRCVSYIDYSISKRTYTLHMEEHSGKFHATVSSF